MSAFQLVQDTCQRRKGGKFRPASRSSGVKGTRLKFSHVPPLTGTAPKGSQVPDVPDHLEPFDHVDVAPELIQALFKIAVRVGSLPTERAI